ncbi:STAS domain-containing protein [candidate division KSB1 bacterium]|nr:STAS domain-containing protein [candidate division KSB1 bacterium]
MESFEVQRRDDGSVSILYVKGYLDAHTAPKLEQEIQKLINEQNFKIIVNFNELSYISSAGLGVFMGFIENVREKNGDIKLTNMNPKIYRVFDLLGFPTLYDILDNENDAIQKFS